MSIVRDILRSYHVPADVVRERLAVSGEAQALGILAISCLLIFIAQWPRLARLAHLDPTIELNARIGGALLAWIFVMPLIFYILSGLVWLVFRAFGVRLGGLSVRFPLFWALLAAVPLWLLHGFFAGFLGSSILTDLVGLAVLCAFLFVWVVGQRSALAHFRERTT